MGHLEQTFEAGQAARLQFLGTHTFDLLGRIDDTSGEVAKRALICAALNEIARRGAPVVRLWGSLRETGDPGEMERAAAALSLLLDENARRARPLRFVVTLMNHQAGWGAPDPSATLDDQDAASPWRADKIYLQGSWREPGHGLLAERITKFRERPALRGSPYVLLWELVNELDTHRHVGGGALRGPEAEALRDTFVVPALSLLAESFPHAIALGDLRGAPAHYVDFARSAVERLPAPARGRLVWTSHVYGQRGRSGARPHDFTWKLDFDLGIAASLGMPFLLGEIGQHLPGVAPGPCAKGGPAHDLPWLFSAALEPAPGAGRRGDITMALFWGEGLCTVEVALPGGTWTTRLGVGGDTADLSLDDPGREFLRAARAWPRFRTP